MEGTEQAKRTKWTTIRVSEETANAIKLLSERWQLSAGQVIDRLLQLYEAYLESDQSVQNVINALETLATEPTRSSPPLVEPEPATATYERRTEASGSGHALCDGSSDRHARHDHIRLP
jgi:hypothetical protein